MRKLLIIASIITGVIIAMVSRAHAESATAIFAGGCFWCMESEFQTTPGVLAVTSGYTGGAVSDAVYEKVAAKKTSHREAVEVRYDASQISYEKLLEIFWSNIDPTDEGGQFFDRGHHYTTAVYFGSEEEQKIAQQSKAALEKRLGKKVATAIIAREEFFPAEAEHQDYFEKNPVHYNAYVRGSGRKEKIKAIHQQGG